MTKNKHLIVYTTEEGGLFHAKWGDELEYEEMKSMKQVATRAGLFGIIVESIAYVALVEVVRDYDVAIDGPREAKES